ncbi:MAG: hypothetical protein DU429_07920 [Candidatus Tokpelaia sp.]|nr:MAG: hypothetical protein DU429_07920 [Candidatus Tokpelaia sp.]KAA6206093.1 MAG: hypothetical protein DU430_02345 [Candidatus Tokpelaia sp.]
MQTEGARKRANSARVGGRRAQQRTGARGACKPRPGWRAAGAAKNRRAQACKQRSGWGRRAQQRTGARKRANSARVGDGGRSKEQARVSRANRARVGDGGRSKEQARVSRANSARVGDGGRSKEQARVSRANSARVGGWFSNSYNSSYWKRQPGCNMKPAER